MSRRKERIALMSLFYELDIKDSLDEDGKQGKNFSEFSREIFDMYKKHKKEIDDMISSSLKNWTISSISKVDLSILRLCVCELMYIESVPKKVAINEALEIAKVYSTDKSHKFINAVIKLVMEKIEQ